MLVFVASIITSGCTVERPLTSDNEGPLIRVIFTGGANYTINSTDNRPLPSDQCAIVEGNIIGRNVDVKVLITDRSGTTLAQIVTEGNGIRPGSIIVEPDVLDIRMTPIDTDFRDEIRLDFSPLGSNVRTGAIVSFNIESTFQAGVTLTVFARDSFGNTTNLAPFRLLSDLANNSCANN